MALKIRLRQQGKKNFLVYRLVLTDGRKPRDGKYLEVLGWYNPHEETLEKNTFVQEDRVQHWLDQGAVLTEKAEKLLHRGAPSLIKKYHQKLIEARVKIREKKKAARKKAVAA